MLRGERLCLAKAITLVESSRAADRELAEQMVEGCLAASGNSIRVGVTGAPGAGKSSLIETLGRHIITAYGEKVAVLAIDPSSQISGGSILGDKTRMPFVASSEMAFIRPSPTRGTMGGVAQHTREAIVLCEAAGYSTIFVETVGVGQSETAVRDMVDLFLLVAIAGAGDELQGIKRGVMEMVDLMVVNKADGDNIRAAEKARAEAASALQYLPKSPSGWIPQAVTCSAQTEVGVEELWNLVRAYVRTARGNGWIKHLRREQNLVWLQKSVEEGLKQLFRASPKVKQRIADYERKVKEGQLTALKSARELLEIYTEEQADFGRRATDRN